MEMKLNRYKNWPQISLAEEIEEIQAVKNPAEWKLDPVGYFLIKVNRERGEIEVGFCTNDHKVRKIIRGKHPEDIYYTLLRHGLISSLMHAANIGEELEKAYIALLTGLDYVQDDELMLGRLKK